MKKYVLHILVLCLCVSAFAEKVVRVGCFDSNFCRRDSFGRLSGYAYEFQQEIATYTGWRYEYVDDSWPRLFQMLKEGKIDLLSDVSFLEERTKHMLFSNYAMGVEKYFLYAPANSPITTSGIKLLEGKKVGVNKGSFQAGLFKKWEEQMGIHAQLIELEENDSLLTEKLRNGELDAVVNGDGYDINDLKVPLVEIGSSDIFFAVNKKRGDLLEDLNLAMAAIYRADNFYNQDLYEKYIFNQGANQFLSGKEQNWLRGHSTIKVGYRDNYMAFCAKDEKTGELKGALKDYLDMMSTVFKNATIKFEPVAYASVQEALDAMNKGEVECVFPVSFGPYDAERMGVLTTSLLPLPKPMPLSVRKISIIFR